jgi:hypothetical protein
MSCAPSGLVESPGLRIQGSSLSAARAPSGWGTDAGARRCLAARDAAHAGARERCSARVFSRRAKAEALGLLGDVGLGSRDRRVVVITGGLVLAPISIWLLVGAIAFVTAAAWLTVLQCILFVRKQLRERA